MQIKSLRQYINDFQSVFVISLRIFRHISCQLIYNRFLYSINLRMLPFYAVRTILFLCIWNSP